MPVIVAGLMTGCRALEMNEELELAHLFSGFKQHTSQLVTWAAFRWSRNC